MEITNKDLADRLDSLEGLLVNTAEQFPASSSQMFASFQNQLNELKGMIIDLVQSNANYHALHESDMARMLPVINAFEISRQDSAAANRVGKKVLWYSGIITAIGSAALIIQHFFFFTK